MNGLRKQWLGAAVAAGIFSFGGSAAAEEAATEEVREVHVPVSAAILPGIGTNGFVTGNAVNNFAFGLLATHSYRLDGLALSPAVTVVSDHARGAQVAGAFNWAGALTGVQTAGAVNVTTGMTRGAQLGGAVNVSGASLRGAQVAGAFNYAGGDSRGWQTAGAVNVADGMRGLQLSGAANVADRLSGLQLSVLNVGGDVDGAQVGVVNIARKVRGLQLGVVNVSSEMYGAPIGLVSIAGNGQFHVQAWASDVALTNVSLKYGSKYVYTIVTAGLEVQRPADDRRFLAGIGFGGHIPVTDRIYVDIDGTAMTPRRELLSSTDGALLSQLRVVGGYQFAQRLSAFGGLTGNVLVDWDDSWGAGGIGPTWEVGTERTRVALWPGLVAGVQL